MSWLKRNKEPKSTIDRLAKFIESTPIAIVRLDKETRIIECNQAFKDLAQHYVTPNKDTKLVNFLTSEDQQLVTIRIASILKGSPINEPIEVTLRLPNKDKVMASLYISSMPSSDESNPSVIAHVIDNTEQKNLETRFAHSQKMQAVGQLAGGVAHDFNNLLTAMIGFCDLLLMRHPAGDPSFADIMQIKQNANRAANLVRQLLAFSRRQTLQPKVLDLTDVLAELSNLIRRLIGENITLEMTHGRNIWAVKADQGQLEQVIINLAVNARDAMRSGGTLNISSQNVTISPQTPITDSFIPPAEEDLITPGDYIQVDISDTGEGIPHDLIEKIFEPFFSTKEVGQGTGLGLATVYGIIKQTEGYLYVKSLIDEGTTFRLFLPRHQEEQSSQKLEDEKSDQHEGSDLTGASTILLVEDETPVRIFAARALRNKGYEVLEADCGENAIEVFTAHEGDIEVIISDVMMPGINGPTMIETLEKEFPERMKEVEVIFISGYAEDAFIDSYGSEREFNFLPKPFTLKQLASKIKEVMQKQAS